MLITYSNFREKKENKRTFRTQIKCDVDNLKPVRNPVWYRKPAKSVDASEGKKFPSVEAIRFSEYFKQFLELYGK